MNEILGIDIDILSLFLLVSICVGMYLNLMVFDRICTMVQDLHDTVMGITEAFQDAVRIERNENSEEPETILFEDGWP